jgi:AraC-like DNA-binding protein
MDFPIYSFAPRRPAAVAIEAQRLGPDNSILRVPPHGHVFFELLLVSEGSGLLMVDGVTHVALPGSMFAIAPGTAHDARGLAKARGWAVLFAADGADARNAPALGLLEDGPSGLVFDRFRRDGPGAGGHLRLRAEELSEIEGLYGRIERELTERAPGYEVAARAALQLLMVRVSRAAGAGGELAHGAGSRPPDLLARAFRDIDLHFHDDSSLAAAGRRLGLAPAHLTTRLRQISGRTYRDWVIERRMIEARHRLGTTEQSLAEIASAIGYQDTESFIRRFRRHHGSTPAAWREQARAGTRSHDTVSPG